VSPAEQLPLDIRPIATTILFNPPIIHSAGLLFKIFLNWLPCSVYFEKQTNTGRKSETHWDASKQRKYLGACKYSNCVSTRHVRFCLKVLVFSPSFFIKTRLKYLSCLVKKTGRRPCVLVGVQSCFGMQFLFVDLARPSGR
jgi:hypothetical protein